MKNNQNAMILGQHFSNLKEKSPKKLLIVDHNSL